MPDHQSMAKAGPVPFTFASRVRSIGYALAGLRHLVHTQHNAWLQLVSTLGVLGAGFWLRISLSDWRWIITSMAAVWSAEAMNTGVEAVCDLVSPGPNEQVRIAKDVAAGAVLAAAIGAMLIGEITLAPYLVCS